MQNVVSERKKVAHLDSKVRFTRLDDQNWLWWFVLLRPIYSSLVVKFCKSDFGIWNSNSLFWKPYKCAVLHYLSIIFFMFFFLILRTSGRMSYLRIVLRNAVYLRGPDFRLETKKRRKIIVLAIHGHVWYGKNLAHYELWTTYWHEL